MPLPTFFNLPEDKRQKILEYAIDEFAQRDYHSASISRVVVRTGISKGSLYQYFKDKQDLYEYLLEVAAQKKAELMTSISPPDPAMSLFDNLRFLFQVMSTYQFRFPLLAKIADRAISGNAPLPQSILAKAKQTTSDYLLSLIEDGKRQGKIRTDLDSNLIAVLFISALSGLSDYLRSQKAEGQTEIVTHPLSSGFSDNLENSYNQIISILQYGIEK